MSVYLVTWDLNIEQDYSAARKKLMDRIEQYKDYIKDPGLDSVVFISSTSWNAVDIYTDLRKYVDENDRIFVVNIGNDYRGRLAEDVVSWINSH